jgi:hypothetical protein
VRLPALKRSGIVSSPHGEESNDIELTLNNLSVPGVFRLQTGKRDEPSAFQQGKSTFGNATMDPDSLEI